MTLKTQKDEKLPDLPENPSSEETNLFNRAIRKVLGLNFQNTREDLDNLQGQKDILQTQVNGLDHLTDLANVGVNIHTVIDTHIADDSKHRIINDAGTSPIELWSADKIYNSHRIGFLAKNSQAQELAHGNWTDLFYNTQVFDLGGCFASHTFTVPAGKAGYYIFTASATTVDESWTAGEALYFSIYSSNGGHHITQRHELSDNLGNGWWTLGGAVVLYMPEGQTVRPQFYQNSGGNITRSISQSYNHFSGMRLALL